MQEILSSKKFHYVTVPGLDFTLSDTTTSEGRLYTTPDGKTYPSASTIAKILTRDGIAAWRARVGAEVADKKTRQGANRGTGVHLVCEQYLLGTLTEAQRMGMLPTTKELFLQISKKLDTHVKTVYAVEQALYSHRLRIAGRTDAIVDWDGEICILDFKTAASSKPEKWILNYFVQSTAYAEMFEERTGIPIKKIVILMAVEDDVIPTIYDREKGAYIHTLQECVDQYYLEHSER